MNIGGTISGAVFSDDNRRFRFALWRLWGDPLNSLLFIGLNPSTAAHFRDDPTVVRVAIIGEATLVDCCFRFGEENDNLYSQWAEAGLYGFTIADPKLYDEPIPCRGALGFFEPNIERGPNE